MYLFIKFSTLIWGFCLHCVINVILLYFCRNGKTLNWYNFEVWILHMSNTRLQNRHKISPRYCLLLYYYYRFTLQIDNKLTVVQSLVIMVLFILLCLYCSTVLCNIFLTVGFLNSASILTFNLLLIWRDGSILKRLYIFNLNLCLCMYCYNFAFIFLNIHMILLNLSRIKISTTNMLIGSSR